jgi:hypothetical protein
MTYRKQDKKIKPPDNNTFMNINNTGDGFENQPVLPLILKWDRLIFSFHPLGFGVKKAENL